MSRDPVPFYEYQRMYENEKTLVSPIIEAVLTRSDFILRKDLENFEQALSKFIGSNFAVGVANGTDAIWLSLIAAGVGIGDEVILPSHTYVATADAVRFTGATPVLVDCSEDHLINVNAIEEAISSRTRAVIPVNLNGQACRLDAISNLALKKDLIVIEDNAQGLGARLLNKSAGTFGLAGTLSFFPAKILGCYGDGGAVITDSQSFAEHVSRLRNHGRNPDGEVVTWGFNSRLDNLQAAILLAKLSILESAIERRRHIAKIYFEELRDLEQLKLPRAQGSQSDFLDSYQNFEIEAANREELRGYLGACGIGTALPWGGKDVDEFNLPGVRSRDLSVTKRIFKEILLLPMNHYLSDTEVMRVTAAIKDFYKK